MWFGKPVYIFNDNLLWVESNFTMDNRFEHMAEND